jgi:hypothetical protein
MGRGHKLGQPVEDRSGLRKARRWRLLLAHDATASTCDPLFDALEGALGEVDVSESSSIDDARLAVRGSADDHPRGMRFHLALVCLDLPPAPQGGVRLAKELVDRGLPVVLVTRSLRWIPPTAASLRDLPWIPPDADAAAVSRAVGEAMARQGATRPPREDLVQVMRRSRPSWAS